MAHSLTSDLLQKLCSAVTMAVRPFLTTLFYVATLPYSLCLSLLYFFSPIASKLLTYHLQISHVYHLPNSIDCQPHKDRDFCLLCSWLHLQHLEQCLTEPQVLDE